MFQSIENMIVFDIKSTRCIINQILLEMIWIYIKFNIKLLFMGEAYKMKEMLTIKNYLIPYFSFFLFHLNYVIRSCPRI